MLFNRKLRTALTLLKPDLHKRIKDRQIQIEGKVRKPVRELEEGDSVFAKNFGSGQKWLRGVVQERVGYTNYRIKVASGEILRRHIDQVILDNQDIGEGELECRENSARDEVREEQVPSVERAVSEPIPLPEEDPILEEEVEREGSQEGTDSRDVQEEFSSRPRTETTRRDRPQREKHAPSWMTDYVVKHLSKGDGMLCSLPPELSCLHCYGSGRDMNSSIDAQQPITSDQSDQPIRAHQNRTSGRRDEPRGNHSTGK